MPDTTDATARAVKLTKPEMARLMEIDEQNRRSWGRASCGQAQITTKKLIDKGMVEPRGGKVAKTGRVVWHADAILTQAGENALAAARTRPDAATD